MNQDRAVKVAVELYKLGLSQAGVEDLILHNSLDSIEEQLFYLPHRKARRPGAFLVDAVRNHYSPPKEFYYAKTEPQSAEARNSVAEDTFRIDRPPDAVAERHRTQGSPGAPPSDSIDATRITSSIDIVLPRTDQANG
jgi:hypothetical protein